MEKKPNHVITAPTNLPRVSLKWKQNIRRTKSFRKLHTTNFFLEFDIRRDQNRQDNFHINKNRRQDGVHGHDKYESKFSGGFGGIGRATWPVCFVSAMGAHKLKTQRLNITCGTLDFIPVSALLFSCFLRESQNLPRKGCSKKLYHFANQWFFLPTFLRKVTDCSQMMIPWD